jgi:alpha-galactosidase
MTSRNSSPIFPAGELSASNPIAQFICGDFSVNYILDARTSAVGLRLLPLESADRVVNHRKHLETPEILGLPAAVLPALAYHGYESLVEIKLAEDDSGGGFSGGRSMRLNPTVDGLRLVKQQIEHHPRGGFTVRTFLRGKRDFLCTHVLHFDAGDEAVTVHTEFENQGTTPLTLEMLSSFSLGYLSPFDAEDSVERLKVHRFRSLWSSEGRHEAVSLEDLHLERSWGSYSVVNERFGQVGSMPVRGFFPFVAIEDVTEGVFWGAQLGCSSSWQMEIYRRDDKISLSGGLADREFGHWMKRIAPGERFATPAAFLCTAKAGLDAFCQRLTRMQAKPLASLPAIEADLPILFNEWCSSWGLPTPAFIDQTAKRLQEAPVRIFVIDDGWAEKPAGTSQFNGDWNVERHRFPDGLRPVTDSLREKGFIPGLWFEFEICTEGTEAFKLDAHKLRRDGRILKVGTRHFWNFNDPWTFQYLTEKVIARLRDDGFGYLKVDYNDTIGLGCDDADSLGEGLRKHISGVQRFFRKLREELPDLIIEVCASGGHRLEPAMLSLAAMGSFSDAHESLDIPIIAANLHRLILPRQSQIWAVLHKTDSLQRIHYSLAACFLGRACLSGEIATLTEEQYDLVKDDLLFYTEIKGLIRDGESRLYREINPSYRNPKGWQVVTRKLRSGKEALLVVAHAFDESAGQKFSLPLPEGKTWVAQREMGIGIKCHLENGHTLSFQIERNFSAYVGYFLA